MINERAPKQRKLVKIVAIAAGCVFVVAFYAFVFFALLGVIGSDHRYYRGDYPDLFTVAINSMLDSRGFRQYSRPMPVILEVIETDDYGRVLFFYTEVYFHGRDIGSISAYSLVISQHRDGEYVYFYPHHNFISVGQTIHLPRSGFIPTASQLAEDFTAEAIEELKMRNNWNRELNLDNAVRVPIVYRKDRNGPISFDVLLNAYIELFEHETRSRAFLTFFIEDAYGRSIYTLQRSERAFVVMFLPDGSFDRDIGVMELFDFQRYQDELKAFKEMNSWNQPLR